MIALKVRDKFCIEPQRESALWASKHQRDLAAPVPGLGPQALPATMPSLDYRLVWHTGQDPLLQPLVAPLPLPRAARCCSNAPFENFPLWHEEPGNQDRNLGQFSGRAKGHCVAAPFLFSIESEGGVRQSPEEVGGVSAGRMPENGMIISVWRVVAPPGYGALGDVVSMGLDPPTAPVQVLLSFITAFGCFLMRKEGRGDALPGGISSSGSSWHGCSQAREPQQLRATLCIANAQFLKPVRRTAGMKQQAWVQPSKAATQ